MMKKTLMFLSLGVGLFMANAQVKVGGTDDSIDDSEVLKIEATDKGVLIPNVFIPDLNAAPPVTNPTDFLLVYNTNPTPIKGYYYWENDMWNPIVDNDNVYEKLGIVKYYNAVSTGRVNDNTLNSPTTYDLDEAPSAHDWQLIPGATKTITIKRTPNNASIVTNGVIQSNLNNASDSYAIAIFMDGELKATRGFFLSSPTSCAYDSFLVSTVLEDIPVGTHTFEVRETYRNNLRGGGSSPATLSFGAKNSSCTNINNDMARTILNIQVVEK